MLFYVSLTSWNKNMLTRRKQLSTVYNAHQRIASLLLSESVLSWSCSVHMTNKQICTVDRMVKQTAHTLLFEALLGWTWNVRQRTRQMGLVHRSVQRMAHTLLCEAVLGWSWNVRQKARQRSVVRRLEQRIAHTLLCEAVLGWGENVKKISKQRRVAYMIAKHATYSFLFMNFTILVCEIRGQLRRQQIFQVLLTRVAHSTLMTSVGSWFATCTARQRQRYVLRRAKQRLHVSYLTAIFDMWQEGRGFLQEESRSGQLQSTPPRTNHNDLPLAVCCFTILGIICSVIKPCLK